jgi:hypothetical protein
MKGCFIMAEKAYPEVASFLIRFIADHSECGSKVGYRGVIRHVQTDSEMLFANWNEVEAFIQQVIPIDVSNLKE